MMGKRIYLLITIIFGFCGTNFAQNVNIVLGPENIALNQTFTITIEVKNEQLKDYSDFPQISGFRMLGQSSSSFTNIINGQYSFTKSLIQNYAPEREGTFVLKPFSMKINGTVIQSPGKTIKVGPAKNQQRRYDPFAYDPFEEFFGKRQPQEFVDVKADAFLALTVDKDEVYVGEGVTATLGFFVAATNQAELRWYEISEQLADIKKKITPSNCWEENFNIEKLYREDVKINNKRYNHYKLFQATYYPFNKEDLHFPAIPLEMMKLKVAKNPTFFGRSHEEDFKTFYTIEKTVKVKELPPHPLREKVPVGQYQLTEKISDKSLNTGQSFTYQFGVVGEGNISAIEKPIIAPDNTFEFYPPNIRQNINRSQGRVTGSKAFNYYAIPNEPGEYNLGDFIYMVYFDPQREVYDTLKSDIVVNSVGESKKNVAISSNDLGSFYNFIDVENNNLTSIKQEGLVKLLANIIIVVMLGLTIFLIFKK